MDHRFRCGVLRFRSTLSHRRRALRYRPVLRTQRPLLLPNHRPERTLGLMGLRIHRSSSLPLPLTLLYHEASTSVASAPPVSQSTLSKSAFYLIISWSALSNASVAINRGVNPCRRISERTLPPDSSR